MWLEYAPPNIKYETDEQMNIVLLAVLMEKYLLLRLEACHSTLPPYTEEEESTRNF